MKTHNIQAALGRSPDRDRLPGGENDPRPSQDKIDRLCETVSDLRAQLGQVSDRLLVQGQERRALTLDMREANQKLADREAELIRLTSLLHQAERETRHFRAAFEATQTAHHDLLAHFSEIDAYALRLREELDGVSRAGLDRVREITLLQGQLREKEQALVIKQEAPTSQNGEALTQIARATVAVLQVLGPKAAASKRKSDRQRYVEDIRKTGLVDAAWYLRTNPDVATNGMDPVAHYLFHGLNEGRAPNPLFQWSRGACGALEKA